jgi:hypothetical protein
VQNGIHATGIIDCLLEPDHGLSIATSGVFGTRRFRSGFPCFVGGRGGDDEDHSKSWPWEQLRLVESEDILEREFTGRAEIVYELIEDVRVRFKGKKMLPVRIRVGHLGL